MKKTIIAAISVLTFSSAAMADITVKVNPSIKKSEFNVRNRYINDMLKPRMDRPEPVTMTANVIDGQFVLPTMKDGNAETMIAVGNDQAIVLYTKPGDNLVVNMNSINPLDYSVTGSKLMEDVSKLDMAATNLMSKVSEIASNGQADEATIHKLNEEYNKIYTDYIAANKDAEGVAFAVSQLEGQNFLDAYAQMTPQALESPIAPLLAPQKDYVLRQMESERKMAELQSGKVDAPDFKFENVDGKMISLSDFRGKWVVIDFWGTWCPWCIKGFPALKEAYAEFKPKLEILGVACNDKYENWKNGLKKYDLPWVNVYNPEKGGGKILEEYAVEGFPTKVIVSPDGKIVNITAGENPEFFNILRNLIK